MTTLNGRVLSVSTRNLGEPTTAAATVGATTLYVGDASTFDEAGGLVSVNGEVIAYTAIDVDADTITLASGLVTAIADQDNVEVYPGTPIKTATVDLGEEGGDSVPVTVPHSLLDRLPDGTREEASAESVTVEQRGTYELVIADVIGSPLVQQSLDYVEDEDGYGLDQSVAQMQDARIIGQLGAAVVSAEQILLAGDDLTTKLAPIPGSTKYALKSGTTFTGAGPITSTTELRMFVFDAGTVKAGRVYDIGIRGLANGTVAGDAFYVYLRYTTDGSDPTTSSPRMVGGQGVVGPMPAGLRAAVNNGTLYSPTTDHQLRIAVTASRQNGTGTLTIRTDAAEVAFQVWAKDLGIDSDSSTALQQTLKSDGSGSDNPTIITYTKTFSATWALGWGDYTNVQEDSWFWTGVNLDYSSGAYGLIGFDYAAIVTTLSASVTPVSCVLRVRPRSRRYGDGLDFRVLTHTNTSLANAHSNYWDTYQGDWHGNGSVYDTGVVKNNAAPNVPVDISLGTTIFNQFKAGSRRGVGIAGVSDTVNGSSGTIYGDGAYQAQLIFTYQG